MNSKTNITYADILEMEDYESIRNERRGEIAGIKKNRRLSVGPHATFYFECYDTVWYQIHEMLRIEKGGQEQIPDEIEAYDTLIPKGSELVATLMFEIPDAAQRARVLASLGGVEETVTLEIGSETVTATAEEDVDRTTADGKASSVQFIHFPLTPKQKAAFLNPENRIILGIAHSNYGHLAVIPEFMRQELSRDLI
ncbi:MAG: DUF3501 family protein [Rhodospirillales bacterium]|nr:DUF3501 family protein [Rhodospirillales bacterium]